MTYTIRDLCERYGVTETTVRAWVRSGDLKALNVGRRIGAGKSRFRITQAALDAFEALRSTTPAPPKMPRRKRMPDVLDFIK